ncbi:MAG TPA: 3-oxoacyl-ACP reductase FabG [Chitinophagales bacterium]|nr:3-oxoacyl-ACP reductase FabG [Chitinophagales bacterium]HNL84440.1 3-oxoacyl-ACP reductase FabG [Chitinophagales bacterium]
MQQLQNKTAIITGAARGIGRRAAEVFAANGANVVIWDVNEEAGMNVEEQIKAQGFTAYFQKVNTVDVNEVIAATAQVSEKFGAIDILINNAGITRDATLQKMSPEQWQQVIDVNLTGVFNCTKAVSPYMIQQQSGRIINTSSVVALYGNFGQSNYVATKAGLIGLTKVWARELGKYNITVNAVAPGFIGTEMIQTVPEKVLETMKDKSALKRIGEPEDIANAYLFLASDAAKFITAHTLSVDGGLTI